MSRETNRRNRASITRQVNAFTVNAFSDLLEALQDIEDDNIPRRLEGMTVLDFVMASNDIINNFENLYNRYRNYLRERAMEDPDFINTGAINIETAREILLDLTPPQQHNERWDMPLILFRELHYDDFRNALREVEQENIRQQAAAAVMVPVPLQDSTSIAVEQPGGQTNVYGRSGERNPYQRGEGGV